MGIGAVRGWGRAARWMIGCWRTGSGKGTGRPVEWVDFWAAGFLGGLVWLLLFSSFESLRYVLI
jgi:hypothetical protein